MAVFDKYDPSLDLLHRYWQLNPDTGLVLPGHIAFDVNGNPYSRTNPIAVESLPLAPFYGDVFVDGLGSAQMAVDGRFTGTRIEVHDGTDNTYWTGISVVGGSVTFDSTEQAFPDGGTKSIKLAAMSVGDVFELDSTTTVDLSGHTSLHLRIWVDSNYTPTDIIEIYGWDGAEVGLRANLADFIEESATGMWQSAVIPLTSMGLEAETITGLRVQQGAKNGPAPTVFLDAIGFEESGGPIVYSISAPPGSRVRVSCIFVTITDVFALSATNSGAYGIPPLGFLSVPTLDNGLLVGQTTAGIFGIQAIWKNFRDMAKFNWHPVPPLTDGTDTVVSVVRMFDPPLVMQGPAATDNIQVQIVDDTSGWVDAGVVYTGFIEPI
jgi:hypothetical protein